MKKTILLLVLITGVCFNGYGRERAHGEVHDYKNSIKLTFLSWISGSTKVSYERALPQIRQSSELCASWIGAGRDKYQNDPKGFTVRYGHKFFSEIETRSHFRDGICVPKRYIPIIIMTAKAAAPESWPTWEPFLEPLVINSSTAAF